MSLFGRKKESNPHNAERMAVLRVRAAAQEKTQSAQRLLDNHDLAGALALYLEAARLLKLNPDSITWAEAQGIQGAPDSVFPRLTLGTLGVAFYRGGFYQEALPLLEASLQDGFGFAGSALPLSALHAYGVPGLCEADPQTAKLWYDRWLKTVTPGRQTEFGRYPQRERLGHYACFDEQGEHSYNGGLFEPVVWDVLDVKDDRVLLLSQHALEYGGYANEGRWKELFSDRLFHPAERALVDGESAFLLSVEQFTQYIRKEEQAKVTCSSTVCASCNQAVDVGLDVTRKENGYSISGTRKNIRYGLSAGEWLSLLTSENVPWLLSDGVVNRKGEVVLKQDNIHYSSDRSSMAVRPAVWVHPPRKAAGKGLSSLFSRKKI